MIVLQVLLVGGLVVVVGGEEELLEGAENGRYKVVAKAEPYKNLPVGPLFEPLENQSAILHYCTVNTATFNPLPITIFYTVQAELTLCFFLGFAMEDSKPGPVIFADHLAISAYPLFNVHVMERNI